MQFVLSLVVVATLSACFVLDEGPPPSRTAQGVAPQQGENASTDNNPASTDSRKPDQGSGGASSSQGGSGRTPGGSASKPSPPGASGGRTQPGSTPARPPVDLPDTDPGAPLVINEVQCRGTEFVELINRGSQAIDLTRFALSDRTDAAGAMPLSGRLAPGQRASFELGLACDEEPAVLFQGSETVDHVSAPLMPATASYARLPDGDGEFALARPTRDAPNAAFVDDAARLFLELTDPVPSSLPEIRITLPAESVASLRGVTAESERPWLEATLRFRDSRGEVGPISTGIHLKGQSVFRDIDAKAAFKLDFDRFEDDNYLFGIEKLTLNNFVQDPSALHERLYYGLLARQGSAAPRVGYVNVWVNDQPFGVYLALESSDEPAFLGRCFGSTAALYEGEYGADLYTGRADNFDQDYGDDPGRAALERVISSFNAASDQSLMGDTDDVIDWPLVIPQMAADLFTGHFDSYTANRNNFTLHIDDVGRLALISGGADQAFTQLVEREVDGGLLLAHCLRSSACTRALDEASAAIAADTRAFLADGGAARLRVDATRLAAAFEDDPRIEWSSGEVEPQTDETISFIQSSSRP